MIWCKSVSMSSETMYTSSNLSTDAGRKMSCACAPQAHSPARAAGGGARGRSSRAACLDADHILVVEVAEDLDLAQRALRVGQVVEGLVDLFYGHLLTSEVVKGRADHAVRAVADGLDERVARVHVEPTARHHERVDLHGLPGLPGLLRRRRAALLVHFHGTRRGADQGPMHRLQGGVGLHGRTTLAWPTPTLYSTATPQKKGVARRWDP
jgi:hypothetical protein